MDTYDLCKLIRQTILNRAAENMNYCWSADFGDKRLREIPATLKSLKFFQPIDPTRLTAEQAAAAMARTTQQRKGNEK